MSGWSALRTVPAFCRTLACPSTNMPPQPHQFADGMVAEPMPCVIEVTVTVSQELVFLRQPQDGRKRRQCGLNWRGESGRLLRQQIDRLVPLSGGRSTWRRLSGAIDPTWNPGRSARKAATGRTRLARRAGKRTIPVLSVASRATRIIRAHPPSRCIPSISGCQPKTRETLNPSILRSVGSSSFTVAI